MCRCAVGERLGRRVGEWDILESSWHRARLASRGIDNFTDVRSYAAAVV
jgi:hypothetical protein